MVKISPDLVKDKCIDSGSSVNFKVNMKTMTSNTIVKVMKQKVKRNIVKYSGGKNPTYYILNSNAELLLASHQRQWRSKDSGTKFLTW